MNLNGTPIFMMSAELAGGVDIAVQQNRNYCLSEGFTLIAKQSNSFSLFLRYQAQAERQYRRALEEFERLRAERPLIPDPEPLAQNPSPQPEMASFGDPPAAPEPTPAAASGPHPSPRVTAATEPSNTNQDQTPPDHDGDHAVLRDHETWEPAPPLERMRL